MSLSVGTAWNETAALARRRARFLFPVAFLLLSLPPALLQLVAPVTGPGNLPEPGAWLLFVPLTVAANLIGALAISRLALAEAESARSAFAAGLKGFLPLLGAALMIALCGAALAIGVALIAATVAAPLPPLLLPAAPARLDPVLLGAADLADSGGGHGEAGAFPAHSSQLGTQRGQFPAAARRPARRHDPVVAGPDGRGRRRRAGCKAWPRQPQPGMAAMLLVLLVSALLQAAIGGLFTTFIARLYAQLAAGR